MTDKELAKESWWNDDGCSGAMSTEKIYECGFLAGLKAGRLTKWHSVADDDLPKEGTEVLNDDGTKVIRIDGHWRYVHGTVWEEDAYIDHWCEIPKYTEE